MPNYHDSQIKSFESTARIYEEKGRHEWAYAKNDGFEQFS